MIHLVFFYGGLCEQDYIAIKHKQLMLTGSESWAYTSGSIRDQPGNSGGIVANILKPKNFIV
jgi:hypothetical protein